MNLPEQFGRYRILKKLGAGGMGAVYLAQDTALGRPVALKVPHFDSSDGQRARQRFLREARAAAALDHPNICHVHDVGEIDGRPYITMAYVEGQPLSELVDPDNPLAQATAAGIVRRLALALGQAHAKGVVHRDLKPSNVILRPDGEPVILDFGLARAPTSEQSRLTAAGAVMGTPAYMAPEQVRGETQAIAARTDVYALGVMLYELLTGQLPFQGPTAVVLVQILQVAPDRPSRLRRDLDPRLEGICLKAMAKDAAQRYATMGQLAEALATWLNATAGQPAVAPPANRAGGDTTRTTGAKPVAIPVTMSERGDTLPRVMKNSATGEEGPRGKPKEKSKGRSTLAVILATGLLLAVGVAGGIYWVVANAAGRDSARSFLEDKIKEGGAGSLGAPDTAIVARVRNASGIDLMPIPRGSFYMGSPNDDKDAYNDEKPQHKVTISNSFYMGKYKVTRGQFQRFVDATGHTTEAEKKANQWTWKKPGFSNAVINQADEHPVVCVSWNDADAFCQWLAKESGANVRLPTEAEWEYSCRAVTEAKKPTAKFYFGDDEAKLGDYAWYSGNSGNTTHPCGQKMENAFGLYDMHGLAWEWCAGGKREYKDRDETDPTDAGTSPVYRGGSFFYDPQFCRAACRTLYGPAERFVVIGFRVLVSH